MTSRDDESASTCFVMNQDDVDESGYISQLDAPCLLQSNMKGVFFSTKLAATNEIRDFDIPQPGDEEVLIKNVAVASNPKDWKVSCADGRADDR